MRQDRIKMLDKTEQEYQGNVLSINTCSSQGNYSMDCTMLPIIKKHLDHLLDSHHIILFLNSAGGDLLVPPRIIRMIRTYFKMVTVIVPERAYSAATLLALGANQIYMTGGASLTPIDPNICIEFGGAENRKDITINTGDLMMFLEYSRRHCSRKTFSQALASLSREIPPSLIGKAIRNYRLSESIGREMLEYQLSSGFFRKHRAKRIIKHLINAYYSHDKLLCVRELQRLGLNATLLSQDQERLSYDLLADYQREMTEQNTMAIIEDKNNLSYCKYEKINDLDQPKWFGAENSRP